MKLIKKSDALYVTSKEITTIGEPEINFLKTIVGESPNKRARINVHPGDDDQLHEMFIILQKDSYVRPHKHLKKSESFHMVYGKAIVVIFYDDGQIKEVIRLAAGSAAYPFYYRMSKPYFHTLILESDIVIMHETTNGPFVADGTIYSDFSPPVTDEKEVKIYISTIMEKLQGLLTEEYT